MRLSELLKLETVNEQGERLGHVHDVRFASVAGQPEGWDATTLIVGPRGFAVRLGYGHGPVQRPRALAVLLRWGTRKGLEVPWERVVAVEEHRVVISGRRSDFANPADQNTGGAA